MKQEIIDYIQQNRNKYSMDDLTKELKKMGYLQSDIENGFSQIHSQQGIKNQFVDTQNNKASDFKKSFNISQQKLSEDDSVDDNSVDYSLNRQKNILKIILIILIGIVFFLVIVFLFLKIKAGKLEDDSLKVATVEKANLKKIINNDMPKQVQSVVSDKQASFTNFEQKIDTVADVVSDNIKQNLTTDSSENNQQQNTKNIANDVNIKEEDNQKIKKINDITNNNYVVAEEQNNNESKKQIIEKKQKKEKEIVIEKSTVSNNNSSGTSNGQKKIVSGMKGTLADDQLVRDTMVGVVKELISLGCKKDYKSVSSIIMQPPEVVYLNTKEWQEKWTVIGCEQEYQLKIDFREEIDKGTTWVVDSY